MQAALDAKDYARAKQEASEVLKTHKTSVGALIVRSTACSRLGETAAALADAELAVRLASTLERWEAQLRRAICLYNLKEYSRALKVIEYAETSPKEKKDETLVSVWKARIEEKSPGESNEPLIPQTQTAAAPVKKDWYQSDVQVYLDVYRKDVPQTAKIEIEPFKVVIAYQDFEYALDLAHEVDPSQSSYEIKKFKVVLKLHKATSEKWDCLDASESSPLPKIQEVKLDLPEEEEEDSVNAFFSRIYKDADPDARRAMIKSFTESRGTSLSTNWSEVGSSHVDPVPPSDLEIRD